MIYYWLALIVCYGLFGYCVYTLYKRRKDPVLYESMDWFILHKKSLLISSITIFVIVTVALIKPLYHTMQCSYYGHSYNTDTQYNWVLGECLYKGKTGAMLPLRITRDVPDGEQHDTTNDNDVIDDVQH